MASLPESYDEHGDAPPARSTGSFDDAGYDGLASETFGSYSEFTQESADDAAIYNNNHQNSSFVHGDDAFAASESGIDAHGYSPEANGGSVNAVFVDSDGPILPPPSEFREEGVALREWRRQNAARLEEKEKMEKETLSQIIQEASEYKAAFYEKRKVICENNKTTNQEKEKLFVANQEKFHKEADQNYWKAIAELIPNEVPTLEKKRGKKDQEKKPSITVVQGPKPGKPTDLSRMRHILVKLKHSTPPHLKLSPPTESAKDPKSTNTADAPPKAAAATPEAVVAA